MMKNRNKSNIRKLLFGNSLELIMELQKGGDMPYIISDCVEWLEKNGGLTREGIFRISGKQTLIDELKARYDAEGRVDLEAEGALEVHTVSGILKLFFRELPEPLFIVRYYSTYLKV